MVKKLILHIGANKTGSSAIQEFLALNARALRKEGIVVPNADLELADQVEGFHVWSFQELFADPEDGRKNKLAPAIQRIFENEPGASAVLFSAENLAANPAALTLFEGLEGEYEIRVVLYIRRQDEYLLSSWQQWNSKITNDFWAWAVSNLGILGNWQLYLENWERVVPRHRIMVRVFDREKLEGGDVIADFSGLLGVAAPFESFAYPKDTANPSFSAAVTDLVKGNKLIFDNAHDNDFYNLVEQMTGDAYIKNSRESALTFAQRRSIVQRYADSNRWVKENYFPDTPGELFPPMQENDYYYLSPEAIQKQQLEFLTTMIYRMYRDGTQ